MDLPITGRLIGGGAVGDTNLLAWVAKGVEGRHALRASGGGRTRLPTVLPRAAEPGIRAQSAIQLVHDGERAGLNLYARGPGVFDRSTVQFAELFATQAAALLDYAMQVEQLGEPLHSRTDIGTAVGIVMERYHIDRNQAFAYWSVTPTTTT